MNQAAESPADHVERSAADILQARRRSPRQQAGADPDASTANQLWDLLEAIEKTFEQHVLNPGSSAFGRLGGDAPQAKAIRNALFPALKDVAGRLRTYRLVSERLDERADKLADHDYLLTHRELSTQSFEITAQVGKLRSAVEEAAGKIRSLTRPE
jgi:hypothetical protein